MKLAVIVFPGSNCDADLLWAVKEVMGIDAEFVRHDATSLAKFDGVLLPGGFLWRLLTLWCNCSVFANYQ